MLPALQHLRVVLIGPDLPFSIEDKDAPGAAAGGGGGGGGGGGAGAAPTPPRRWQSLRMETCPACAARGRLREIVLVPCRYEGFLGALEEAHGADAFAAPLPSAVWASTELGPPVGRPDLVIAFNSGLHATPASFADAFRRVVASGWPLALTAYNEAEAAADARALRDICAGGGGGGAEAVSLLVPPEPFPFASDVLSLDVEGAEGVFTPDTFLTPNTWFMLAIKECG